MFPPVLRKSGRSFCFRYGTPPTRPRKPSDQFAYVRKVRSTGRLKNFLPAPICGAIVNLRSQPSYEADRVIGLIHATN